MRISALCTAVVTYVVIGHPPPAVAQVDQQRAQEYFKEAQALCERDGGRLWGVSICAPMVIGDSADTDDRHQPAATGRASPTAHRSAEWADPVGRHDVGGAHLGHDRQLAGSHVAARHSSTNRSTSSSRSSDSPCRRIQRAQSQ